MPTILFYASVANPSLFNTQKFYVNTIEVLKELGCKVIVTNNIADAWKKDYDAIFSFFYRKSVIPSYIAKIRGKKVFFTGGIDAMEHSIVSDKAYYTQVVLFKLCRWIADWCLIESSSDMRNINKISLFKNHKNLYYSPQAMNLNKYDCDGSLKENIFSSICWMESMPNVQRKGIDQSLYYFKYLRSFKEFADSKYYIMGRIGKGTDYLKKIISDLGLNEDVVFTGEVSDETKIEYLKRSKYYFQLSKYEGFGLAALEAVAAGCITIHSGRGGLADVVANDGVLVNISKFKNDINSIDISVYEKLTSALLSNSDKMKKRIYSTFDWPIRVNNFKKTIGQSLNIK